MQSGGFTGLRRSAAMTLGELEPDVAAEAATALRALGERRAHEAGSAGGAGGAGAAPSQPRYELTVRDGAQANTIVLYQSEVPAELEPLVTALKAKL